MPDSKIVSAVGISVNGHLPIHEERIRRAMELEVSRHHHQHGSIDGEHTAVLKNKLHLAHRRELNLITSGQ